MLSSIQKLILLFAFFGLSAGAASAQSMQDVVSQPETPLTWLGLDFSGVRYHGNPGTVSPDEMKGLFKRINDLLIQEPEKYNLAKALRRERVTYAFSVADAVNERIDPATLLSNDPGQRNRFTAEAIQRMVKNYALPEGSAGIGVVFIVEDLVKYKELATMWVTFVDMSSKTVLYTEKFGGTAEGIGFRNHWAHGAYSTIKLIKAQKYGEWKKRFVKG